MGGGFTSSTRHLKGFDWSGKKYRAQQTNLAISKQRIKHLEKSMREEAYNSKIYKHTYGLPPEERSKIFIREKGSG